MNDFEMEEYELLKVVEALIEHVQELTIELASVLRDVCRYLPENTAQEIRRMRPQDYNWRLMDNEFYKMYVQDESEGSYDPLPDEDYADHTDSGRNDDDEDIDLPVFYSRKEELIKL